MCRQISKEKQRIILFFNETSHHEYKFVRFTTLPGEQEQIAQLMSLHAKQIQKAKRENKKAAEKAKTPVSMFVLCCVSPSRNCWGS
eukprot:COSAG01_NODE_1075_length_11852_cov_4.249128_2_plen_86_part_00